MPLTSKVVSDYRHKFYKVTNVCRNEQKRKHTQALSQPLICLAQSYVTSDIAPLLPLLTS